MATFYFLGNTSHSQMLGCVIQTEKHTIMIDGGTTDDCGQLVDFLETNAGSHVDAWFFTHPHHDHIGSFTEICKNAPHITVERVCHHFPTPEELFPHTRTEKEKAVLTGFFEIARSREMHTLQVGDTFTFDDVSIRVLRVYDPAITENFVNNSSTVYRIEGKAGSFLILGDLGVDGGDALMKNCPLPLLQADYTQMAHHGQAGVSKAFYEYIKPKKCLWATPDWLWDNDAGDGFDTGPWFTVRTREWVADLGVTEHFIEKDGTHKFEF